jgi:magnesium-protoporphyrin IX monomethyl ester (oxidative) cyclase
MFADWIGVDLNEQLAEGIPTHLLAGDWLFADELGAVASVAEVARHRRALTRALRRAGVPALQRLRERVVPGFVRMARDAILQRDPAIVGFSTMFQQTAASLAIAAAVKREKPSAVICFGGANCHGPMGPGLLRSYAQIDYVFTGEADLDFPAFATALLAGQDPARSVGGFVSRGAGTAQESPPVRQLDDLPVPDYRDYFVQLGAMAEADRIRPSIPFETSRGCWWGQKHHCTFCGLNAEGMVFREKTGERALSELETLRRTYGIERFAATDNIMSLRHIQTVMKRIAADDTAARPRLFYEVKSNLDAAALETLGRAGVSCLQPGIESLSDDVLRIMRKGVTALLNLRLMRNCRELGIGIIWNILYGFPNEPRDAYGEMAALIPLIEHLHPPNGCSRIRLDRFSPNFERAEKLGFRQLRPVDAYGAIFAAAATEVRNVAYFFSGEAAYSARERDLVALRRAVEQWRTAWFDSPAPPQLTSVRVNDGALIYDTRRIAAAPMQYLQAGELALLDRLHSPVGVNQLAASMDREPNAALRQQALSRLLDLHLVIRHGDRLMSLVVDAGREVVDEAAGRDFPLGYLRARVLETAVTPDIADPCAALQSSAGAHDAAMTGVRQ